MNEFDNVVLQIAKKARRTLQFIPDKVKKNCEEIRLRVGKPITLTIKGEVVFVSEDSSISTSLPTNPLIATRDVVEESVAFLCNNSIYLHESEIKQGFISLPNGARAGVCGVFNADGMLISVTSINVRIARQIYDCATSILPYSTDGILIAGPPGSGKTTLLRDLIRLLSNGKSGRCYRVAVIDSRREISGGGALDIGINTDVFYTANKATGVQMALRTMFPDFIAFDEIGTIEELDSVRDCFNAGVSIITTAHCNEKADVFDREIIAKIIKSKAIKNVALLNKNIGEKPQIITDLEIEKIACN